MYLKLEFYCILYSFRHMVSYLVYSVSPLYKTSGGYFLMWSLRPLFDCCKKVLTEKLNSGLHISKQLTLYIRVPKINLYINIPWTICFQTKGSVDIFLFFFCVYTVLVIPSSTQMIVADLFFLALVAYYIWALSQGFS